MTESDGDSAGGAVERQGHASDNELERLAARLLNDISGKGEANGDLHGPVMLSEKYRGPFTHPHILKELNEIVENGAERAFKLTENEQQFRHDSVRQILSSEIENRRKEATDRRLVIILIFIFLILCLAGAFAAVMTGHNTGAGLVAGAGAVISGAALLINKRSRERGKG